jgi:SAM-dependent methyltransferase
MESTSSTGYVPRDYWDKRLQEHWDLTGVGYIGFSKRYNKWLYRFQRRALGAALRNAGVRVEGARVLDVGSGIGVWVAWYYGQKAGRLTSVDITPTAVTALRRLFPQADVHEADITKPDVDVGQHDIVNIISVIYHIVDPELFKQALRNLAKSTAPGGHLVLSDRLGPEELTPAVHVRFRTLSTYRAELEQLGFDIVHVQPMHTLMNGGFRGAFRRAPGRVRGLAHRTEELLAPALFALDHLPIVSSRANSNILIARKRP